MSSPRSHTTKLFRLSEELKRQIDLAAARLDMDASQFIRHACREKLSRHFTKRQIAAMKIQE